MPVRAKDRPEVDRRGSLTTNLQTANSRSLTRSSVSLESTLVGSWLALFWASVLALAVDVPYYDEWFHLRWALEILDGGPFGAGPFGWVNGTRLVLFKSFLLGALRTFGTYSPLLLMVLSAICSTFCALACVTLLRRALPSSPVRTLASLAVVSLIASPAHHEALFWGLGLSIVLPGTLLIAGSIAVPQVAPSLRVPLAFVLSLFGLASFAAGVALFVPMGFAAIRAGVSRRAAISYVALSALVLIGWHADLSTLSVTESVQLSVIERMWRLPAHFLAALGSGMASSVLWPIARKGSALLGPLVDSVAVVMGFLPLAVFGMDLARVRRKAVREANHGPLTTIAWTLFLFSASSAAMIALGRHDQGISQALSSRYLTLTVFALVAVVFILALEGWRWSIVLLVAASVANAGAGLVVANAWRQARVEGLASLPFVLELPELPGFEALAPTFPTEVAADLMRRRMISSRLAPEGIRAKIERAAPTASPPPCLLAPPGALTPSYMKPTPALVTFSVDAPRPGSLLVVGRTKGIRALAAASIKSAGSHTASATLKGAASGPIDIEAWLLPGNSPDSVDALIRVGACHGVVPQ